MDFNIDQSWRDALSKEFDKDYFKELVEFIHTERLSGFDVYPKYQNIFNAFNLCSLNNVRVVIIGQDPYHAPGQAHGLCFSVQPGNRIPPSLTNIYKEIENDTGHKSITSGDLTRWADQGVLLLNSTLTVRAHVAASHAGRGWEHFTDAAVRKLTMRKNIVYILWGSYAARKAAFVDTTENLVLSSVHPSPLSAYRGFFGAGHFSATNKYLVKNGGQPIIW